MKLAYFYSKFWIECRYGFKTVQDHFVQDNMESEQNNKREHKETTGQNTKSRMVQFSKPNQNNLHYPNQKLLRVETCNGPLCVGKQASEYSIC